MPCSELETLRAQATQARKQLLDVRNRARALASGPAEHNHARSDFEVLLERKLARLAQDIERHIGTHGCN
jgi:hypothetical protein